MGGFICCPSFSREAAEVLLGKSGSVSLRACSGGEPGWGPGESGGCSPPSPAGTRLPCKLLRAAILCCLRVRQVVIHPEILIKTL